MLNQTEGSGSFGILKSQKTASRTPREPLLLHSKRAYREKTKKLFLELNSSSQKNLSEKDTISKIKDSYGDPIDRSFQPFEIEKSLSSTKFSCGPSGLSLQTIKNKMLKEQLAFQKAKQTIDTGAKCETSRYRISAAKRSSSKKLERSQKTTPRVVDAFRQTGGYDAGSPQSSQSRTGFYIPIAVTPSMREKMRSGGHSKEIHPRISQTTHSVMYSTATEAKTRSNSVFNSSRYRPGLSRQAKNDELSSNLGITITNTAPSFNREKRGTRQFLKPFSVLTDEQKNRKRGGLIFDPATIYIEIIRVIQKIFKSGCDESTLFAILTSEFGRSSMFVKILFDNDNKFRRLMPRDINDLYVGSKSIQEVEHQYKEMMKTKADILHLSKNRFFYPLKKSQSIGKNEASSQVSNGFALKKKMVTENITSSPKRHENRLSKFSLFVNKVPEEKKAKKTETPKRKVSKNVVKSKLKLISNSRLVIKKKKILSDDPLDDDYSEARGELSRLPFLVEFLQEKLKVFKLQMVFKTMKEGVKTFAKIAALKERKEAQELVQHLGDDGSFKPVYKVITGEEQDSNRMANFSSKMNTLNEFYFPKDDDFGLYAVQNDPEQEQNDIWRQANQIMEEIVDKEWVYGRKTNQAVFYRQIQKPPRLN